MEYHEVDEILRYLKELWPHWKWAEDEQPNLQTKIWRNKLFPFNYSIAMQAIENIYSHGLADFQRELLPAFLKEANRIAKKYSKLIEAKEKPEPVLVYTIVDQNNEKWKMRFYHPTKMPEDKNILAQESFNMKEQIEQQYNRDCYIVRNWEEYQEPVYQEVESNNDDIPF